jgi:ATP-binding cassette, subfamily B, bacterial PglK
LKDREKSLNIVSIFKGVKQLIPDYLYKKGVKHAIQVSFLSILDFTGLVVLVPLLLAALDANNIIDSKVIHHIMDICQFSDIDYFILFLFCFSLVFFIFKFVLAFVFQKNQKNLISHIVSNLSGMNIRWLFKLNYQETLEADNSKIMEWVYFQPYYLGSGILMSLFVIFQESIILLLIIVALIFVNPLVSILLFCVLGFSFLLLNRWVRNKSVHIGTNFSEKREELFGKLNIGINGLLDIKQNSLEKATEKRLTNTIRQLLNIEFTGHYYKIFPFRVNELIALFGIIMMVAYGLFFRPDSAAFHLLGTVFILSVFRAIPAVNRLQLNLVQLRMNQHFVTEMLNRKSLAGENEIQNAIEFKEKVSLNNIHFKFSDSTSPLLDGVHLDIYKGEIIGLTGPSGSGKSTILKILAGQISEHQGQMIVDDTVLKNGLIKSWQNQLGYAGQTPFFYKASIAENIAFGTPIHEINKARLLLAMRISGLHEFEKDAFSRQTGEGGVKLSEGQKQRLIIARAMYRDAPLILLDEVTSNLDSESRDRLIETLASIKEIGKTLVLIAHNENVLQICDKVFEIKKGKLVKTKK